MKDDNYISSASGITIVMGGGDSNYLKAQVALDRLRFKGRKIIDELGSRFEKESYLDSLDYTDEKYHGYELLSAPGSFEDLIKGVELIMGSADLAKDFMQQIGIWFTRLPDTE